MIFRTTSIAVIAVLLAGCAPQRSPLNTFRQVLENAPGNAQPSNIVAREIELFKRAREIGRSEAALEFASANALALTEGGEASTAQFMALTRSEDVTPWQPKTVWLSCDGRFAVSDGRFETAAGLVGDYMTSWVRSRITGDYVWLHNAAAFDDPQPPPRPAEVEPGPNEIVVDGLISVKGHVADCDARPEPLPAASSPTREVRAQDGTLVWRWRYVGAERHIELHAWTEGEWQIVMDRRWPAEVQS